MGTFHIFHSGSIPFSEQRSIFVGRRNCHAWPFVATSQEAVLILQALRRSAESGHGFAAHYSKALGKLREKHDDIGQVLVCIGYTLALDEWTACATQTKKHTEGEGKCNDNCKTAIKFQGIGPDHFASSTTFRGCLLLSREWGAKTSRHIQDSWQISWFLWSLCLEKPPMVETNSYKFLDSSPECFGLGLKIIKLGWFKLEFRNIASIINIHQPWLEHPSLKDDLPPGETGNDLRLLPILQRVGCSWPSMVATACWIPSGND